MSLVRAERRRFAKRRLNRWMVIVALLLLAAATASVPAAVGGGKSLILTLALLAFAIPFTFLSTNPELESVETD